MEDDDTHAEHYAMAEDNRYDAASNQDSDLLTEKPYFSQPFESIILFKKDEKAVFKCPAMGVPKPVITWLKNNESVSQKLVQNGELIFDKVDLSDSGIYTCTASNSAGSISISFQCLIHNPENTPVIISTNSTVHEHETVVMKCPIDNDITWIKRTDLGDITKESQESSLPQLLILNSVTTSDSGVYTCSVRSKLDAFHSIYLKVIDLNNHSVENQDIDDTDNNDHDDGSHGDAKTSASLPPTGYLNPNVSEEAPRFTKRLIPTLVKPAGNMVRMKCLASGNPVPNITWYKNDKTPVERNLGSIKTSRWQIMLEDLVTTDSGNYTCVVCNIKGCINFTYKLEVIGK